MDIGNFQTALTNLQVGDRVEIRKNLSGDIISVREEGKGYNLINNTGTAEELIVFRLLSNLENMG